jgi:hypothetical protein
VTRRRGRRRKQLLDDLKEINGAGDLKRSARLQSVNNSLWRRLWTYHKADYRMNGWVNFCGFKTSR